VIASSHGLSPSRAVVGLSLPRAAGIAAAMVVGVVAAASPPWEGTLIVRVRHPVGNPKRKV
jgi:hypothetical protein